MTTGPDNNSDTLGREDLWQVRDFVEDAEPQPVNPLATLARLFRGQWRITAILALGLGFAFGSLAFFAAKPIFESEGLVRVIAKEPKILYADSDDSRLRLYDAFVSAEVTYLQSQKVLEKAFEILLDKLDAQESTLPRPSAKDYADAVVIQKLKGLISVRSKSSSPALAQQSVNALLASYGELHMEQSGSRQTLRARELEVRVGELVTKQQILGEQLLKVGEEYDASSLAKAHLTKVTQLEELDLRVGELTNTLLEMETSDGALDADTGDMEIKRATLLDRAMADMVFERAKRAAELEKLLLRYQPQHPKVETLSASLKVIDLAIESRRRLIATLGKTGAITGGDGADKSQSLAELHALKKKLISRRDELSKAAIILNGKLIDLKRLNEEKSQVSGMLAETRRILDQVRLESRNSLPGTVEILSRASAPNTPVSDKRKQFALLGLLFGSIAGAAITIVRRQLSGELRYSDDLTSLMPPGAETQVIGKCPSQERLTALLADYQLDSKWQNRGTTIVSVTRMTDSINLPLSSLAAAASKLGMRTLLVCTSEEGASEREGFIEQIGGEAAFGTYETGTYHYLPFGKKSTCDGYTLQKAQSWIQEYSGQYDLILLYSGIAERHFSTRLIPSISHVQTVFIAPGDSTRATQRLIARSENLRPIFVTTQEDDPGLSIPHDNDLTETGEHNEQVA